MHFSICFIFSFVCLLVLAFPSPSLLAISAKAGLPPAPGMLQGSSRDPGLKRKPLRWALTTTRPSICNSFLPHVGMPHKSLGTLSFTYSKGRCLDGVFPPLDDTECQLLLRMWSSSRDVALKQLQVANASSPGLTDPSVVLSLIN